MGLKSFLFGDKEEEQVQVNMTDLRGSLLKDGFESELIDKVMLGIENKLGSRILEKTEMDYDDFISTFTSSLEGLYRSPEERMKACCQIDEFLKSNPEVYNSMKLYASYLTYGSAEMGPDEYRFVLSGNSAAAIDEAHDVLLDWEKSSKIRRLIFLVARDLVSYSDSFFEKIYTNDGKLSGVAYVPSNTMVLLLDNDEPTKYFQVLDKEIKFSDTIKNPTFFSKLLDEKKIIQFEPTEICHFNDGTIPGVVDSPLEGLTILWRFMRLIEEAFVIHRVTRARRLLVFFLDVSGKTKEQVRKTVGNFTSKLKSIFRLNPETGSIYQNKSVIPSSSDLVIPITKDSTTKLQQISSDPSASKIMDLQFYLGRILSNMLTAHIYSGGQSTGRELYMEKALFRLIKIYQKQMSYTLSDLYEEVLETNGIKDVSVSIMFPLLDSSQEMHVVETVVRRSMVVNQLVSVLGFPPPPSWTVQYVLRDLTTQELEGLQVLLEEQAQAAEEAQAAAPAEEGGQVPPASANSYATTGVPGLEGSEEGMQFEEPPESLTYGQNLQPVAESRKRARSRSIVKTVYNQDSANKALEIAISYLQSVKAKQ